MKKLSAILLAIFLISGASATTIESESLTLDLESSEATAEVKVAELTSSSFTYITSADVRSVSAQVNGEELDCSVETLTLGDEIVCDTDLRNNFTVSLKYSFSGLVSNGGEIKTFRYSHPIYRPTQRFNLRVELPEGAGTAQDIEGSAITPVDGNVGSDGRTIFVEWNKNPQIGDTLNFRIDYETLNPSQDYSYIIGGAVALLLVSVIIYGGYIYRKRINLENLEDVYADLSEDQQDIVELLRENDGEMLQKDVVNSSDYSKAKISGLVSELVEKDVIEKEKEGRSNKLKISGSYRY
ncbi:MAG: putative membrane protein [Candidatus Nanohaloarchaea archaeon]|jgi:uncharacterized membrane protein